VGKINLYFLSDQTIVAEKGNGCNMGKALK